MQKPAFLSPLAAASSLAWCAAATPAPAYAQTGILSHRAAEFASHEGTVGYLAAGVLLPLVRDGGQGPTRFWRSVDALGTATVLSEGLKRVFREPRPDGSGERNSFPSGHATAAFAIATMQGGWRRGEAPLWYLGAFLIADSRVRLNRHRPKDVIAGAALGSGTAVWERSQPRGLILAPFVRRQPDGRWQVGASGAF